MLCILGGYRDTGVVNQSSADPGDKKPCRGHALENDYLN